MDNGIVIVVAPRPEDDELFPPDLPLEFVECASCHAELGSPSLCLPCLQNREVIDRLKRQLARARDANSD